MTANIGSIVNKLKFPSTKRKDDLDSDVKKKQRELLDAQARAGAASVAADAELADEIRKRTQQLAELKQRQAQVSREAEQQRAAARDALVQAATEDARVAIEAAVGNLRAIEQERDEALDVLIRRDANAEAARQAVVAARGQGYNKIFEATDGDQSRAKEIMAEMPHPGSADFVLKVESSSHHPTEAAEKLVRMAQSVPNFLDRLVRGAFLIIRNTGR